MAKTGFDEPFNRYLQVRINDAIHATLARKAKRAGFRTISEWARQRLLASDEPREQRGAA